MKKYILFSILVFFAFACFPAQAFSQGFTGPVIGGPVTVSTTITAREVLDLPGDSWVMLSGYIANALPGGKFYVFRDATGELIVEIGAKEWRGVAAGPSEQVEICGELKIKNAQIRIKIKAIAAHGQTISERFSVSAAVARTLPKDSWVVLNGNLVNALGNDHYTFRDAQGDIVVKIGRKTWRGFSAGVSDRVEICGKVKIKNGQILIDADAIRGI